MLINEEIRDKEIRVIGATTTEESRFLKADKALARRFTEVELQPLRDEAATMTAKGIMETYLKLHGVSAPNVSSAFLLDKINAFLPNTVFPDNFINVVDDFVCFVGVSRFLISFGQQYVYSGLLGYVITLFEKIASAFEV